MEIFHLKNTPSRGPHLISEEKLEVISGSVHKILHIMMKDWSRKWPTQLKSSFRKHARQVLDCTKFQIPQ